MTVGLALDPDGTTVNLNDGTIYRLVAPDLPEPKVRPLYTGSFDTEGSIPVAEHGYENREITVGLAVFAGDNATLLDRLSVLKQAQGKINREHNGVLRLTFPSATVIDFDLIEAQGAEGWEHTLISQNRANVTLSFVAKPFWRGTEVDLGTFSETTLPFLSATLPAIDGDVPALGRMVVTDSSANDQFWVVWGVQSRFYDAASTAALFYQVEGLTPLGGAATAAGATGASGAGSNVVRQGTLTPTPQAMLSTQASGGAHMTHVGSFDVLARIYMPATNIGAVSVALQWAQGDFIRRTTNDWVDFDADHAREGQFVIVRLGQVHIADGTPRWEGRLLASSTHAGDDLDVDCLALIPIPEGSGELSGIVQFGDPSSFLARDEFDQTAGALVGKTLPVGGTWTLVTGTAATDFAVTGSGEVTRSTIVGGHRHTQAGTTSYTNVVAMVNLKTSDAASVANQGLFLRLADTGNYLRVSVSGGNKIRVLKTVASVDADLLYPGTSGVSIPNLTADTYYTLAVALTASGQWTVWFYRTGAPPVAIGSGSHVDLATGGTLATGKIGLFDSCASGTNTRTYDNLAVYAPAFDAAIYASQSLELTHDSATREDSTGAFSAPVSSVRGDYLRLAPAGREGRVNRLIVKASRTDPDAMADTGIDDLQVQVFATPRGVSIPSS